MRQTGFEEPSAFDRLSTKKECNVIVDNRIFTPIVFPFIVLAVLRSLYAVAGAEWTYPGGMVTTSIVIGLIFSVITAFTDEAVFGRVRIPFLRDIHEE